MATSLELTVANSITTNITSCLRVSPDYNNFATITRQLSTNSSQWIYRLDFYDFNTLNKIQTIDVYQTYNTDKHFFTFVPTFNGQSLIALATINNLIFYAASPLRILYKTLHHQLNVYDLTASPNGDLVVLVGQQIVMYRTIGFKKIIFPQIVQNARYCDFSRDGMYMVIASTSSINVYIFNRINDNYQFQQVPLTKFQAEVNYGSITSVQFNPKNSTEIIVGYLSSSPTIFSLSNGGSFFKKLNDIQPMSAQNAKIAAFMPDGSRYYSFDYLDGVGLWPGLSNRLYYIENFLLYDTNTDKLGTRLIGYVWQQIKIVNIQLKCGTDNKTVLICPCPEGQAYNYTIYSCGSLVCLQAEYATGVVLKNECQCVAGFTWDPVSQKCIIDCSKVPNALQLRPNPYQCYCGSNWSWNPLTRQCMFDCTQVPYSAGTLTNSTACTCLPGFVWSARTNQCQCPRYMIPSGSGCLCVQNYYLNEQGSCLANCTLISNTDSENFASNPQECLCKSGYYFVQRQGKAGCQLNCSAINSTVQQKDFDSCRCHQNMDWLNNTCVINCQAIEYSDSAGLANNTCNCAINYNWQDNIKECARNCNGIKNIDPNGQPTLRACPCIENFLWNQANIRCQIQCDKISNSEQYTLSQVDKCECRPGFIWTPSNYTCQVDCDNIWNAGERVNSSSCTCKNGQPFNSSTLTCGSAGTAGVFSSTLSIVGFSIGCAVALIILIILIRFCWKFKSGANQEHQKKIKGKDPKKKKNKLIKHQKAPPMLEQDLKTNERLERLATNTKIKTATTVS